MSALAHEVIVVRSAEDRKKCFDIRFEVFHKEQKFPADTEIDEYDKGDKATHFLLRLTPSLTPVGTVRCVKRAAFTYKLTRLAVLKNYRKQNLGRYLVLALHDWVQHQAQLELINADSSLTNFASDTTCPAHAAGHTNTADLPDQGSVSPNAPPSARIIIHSQIPVEGFYARFGYQPEGEEFDEEGEPHRKMVVQLPLRHMK